MGRRSRETLKLYFKRGSLPNEEQFHDLIDSTLNMNDEGFSKSPQNGLEISAEQEGRLLGLFRRDLPLSPAWRIALGDPDGRALVFREGVARPPATDAPDDESAPRALPPGERPPTLVLGPDGHVGLNTATPEHEVDVNGVIRARGRLGVVPARAAPSATGEGQGAASEEPLDPAVPVDADGRWQNITLGLTGCRAFEIVAGVGKRSTGRYALLHAIAINTFQPRGWLFNFLGRKNRIRAHQAFYRRSSDKLALRWRGDEERYYLQIRTNTDYGVDAAGRRIRIRYHVTDLWPDPYMEGSWKPDGG